MSHAFAIAESIVAPTLFRPEFSHSLDPTRTFRRVYQECKGCNGEEGREGLLGAPLAHSASDYLQAMFG